jgi:hypothetical protein
MAVATSAPKSKGHMLGRLTAVTIVGQGLDGYDLGTISVVLPIIILQDHVSAATAGLIGAS